MSEDPEHPPSLWKRASESVRTDTKEWIFGGLGTALLAAVAWFREQTWKVLTDAVQVHPGETLLLVALGTTILAVGKWIHWKQVAKLALEKGVKSDDLERQVQSSRETVAKLRAALDDKNADPLDPNMRLSFTALLCAKRACAREIAKTLKTDVKPIEYQLVLLQNKHQFVKCVGVTEAGEDVFEVTDLIGAEYARKFGIQVIEQSDMPLRP